MLKIMTTERYAEALHREHNRGVEEGRRIAEAVENTKSRIKLRDEIRKHYDVPIVITALKLVREAEYTAQYEDSELVSEEYSYPKYAVTFRIQNREEINMTIAMRDADFSMADVRSKIAEEILGKDNERGTIT